MDTTQALAALRDFFEAVPGFETANYSTYSDYRKDYREALRDLHECRKLYKSLTDSVSLPLITLDDIAEASRVFSGRLQFTDPVDGKAPFWNYTPGQYYPIEYRAASRAVLSELARIATRKWNEANGFTPCAHCGMAVKNHLLSGIDTCPPCSEKWAKS